MPPLAAAKGGGQGEKGEGWYPRAPDVNVGPNTAYGGKGRKRP